jgi:hypothetical protein
MAAQLQHQLTIAQLVEQLPEGPEKDKIQGFARKMDSFITQLQENLASNSACKDAIQAIQNLKGQICILLEFHLKYPNDNDFLETQAQRVIGHLRETIATFWTSHPNEMAQLVPSVQYTPGTNGDRLENLICIFERPDSDTATEIVVDGCINVAPQDTNPSENDISDEIPEDGHLIDDQPDNNPLRRDKKALKIIGGVLAGGAAVCGMVTALALIGTGVGAPVGAIMLGSEAAIIIGVVGGVTVAGATTATVGTAVGAYKLKKQMKKP